jgi:GDP-L-fucose synthase
MPIALDRSHIAVTGGGGFLGRSVVRRLRECGAKSVFSVRSREFDLRERNQVRRLLESQRPDLVVHLAAVVGGIGANRCSPGRFFFENLLMGTYVMEESRLAGVEKLLAAGTVCSYPKRTAVPFREDDLWSGYPEETNAAYGLAKKMLLVQGDAYRAEYGFNSIHLLPANLYGPGQDPDPATSHVVPALVRKLLDAKARGDATVSVWGSGRASREFLYVEDAAEAVVLALERYDGTEPVNVGAGAEVPIRTLAEKLRELVGFEGRLVFDPSQPDGQPRRCLDTSRAERLFGFRARTPLDEGLRRTVEWYWEQATRGVPPG